MEIIPPTNWSDSLYRLAEQQGGYFTTLQAKQMGLSQRQLTYYVRSGKFLRVRPGVYRLVHFPSSPYESLYAGWLEVGLDAVISHESALALYDLSDVLPAYIHLTVPRTTSRRHVSLRLHTNQLGADEITHVAGLPITTVARTIADTASGGLADELIEQAVHEAIRRGLASRAQLLQTATSRGGRALSLIRNILGSGDEVSE